MVIYTLDIPYDIYIYICISCFRIISHIQLERYIHMQTNKTPVINLYVNMYNIYIYMCVCISG